MNQIIPAVIPKSRRHLDEMLELFGGFTDTCQVDVVDGIFDDSVSWPYTIDSPIEDVLASLSFEQLAVELDLMIQNPEETLDVWQATKPARIIVHVESTERPEMILKHAGTRAYQLGLAFNNNTDLGVLHDLDIAAIDFVQLMGIAEIGEQGNPFDERVLARTEEVKRMFPDMPVSIDGGVTKETLPRMKKAGADRFVSGSAILQSPNPAEAYRELEHV